MEDQNSQNLLQQILDRLSNLENRIYYIEKYFNIRAPKATAAPAPAQVSDSSHVENTKSVEKKTKSTEVEIGQKWFSVGGVILLFLGVLFLVSFIFQYIGPESKVLLSYLVGLVLFGVSLISKKKYGLFSRIVMAGAWGIVYLTTFAMYFFAPTRIITSIYLEMALLSLVDLALLAVALVEKNKGFIVLGLIFSLLTTILSPLSLFSVLGTVIILAVSVALVVYLDWDALLLGATLGAYASFLVWFGKVFGLLPAEGGGLFEKHYLGLIVLLLLWILVAVAILLKKNNSQSLGGDIHSASVLLASLGTTFLGIAIIRPLIINSLRTGTGFFLLVMTGLHAGLLFLLFAKNRERKLLMWTITPGFIYGLLGIAFFLPEGSSGVSMIWASIGLLLSIGSIVSGFQSLTSFSLVPFIASGLRFMVNDLTNKAIIFEMPSDVVTGIVNVALLILTVVILRTKTKELDKNSWYHKIPATLLSLAIIILFTFTQKEFSGAVPSVLWGIVGLTTVAIGFIERWSQARIIGLISLALAVFRVFSNDLANLEILPKIISFMVLGAILLLIGFTYSKYKDKIQQFLE